MDLVGTGKEWSKIYDRVGLPSRRKARPSSQSREKEVVKDEGQREVKILSLYNRGARRNHGKADQVRQNKKKEEGRGGRKSQTKRSQSGKGLFYLASHTSSNNHLFCTNGE